MKILVKSARIIDPKSPLHHKNRDILIEDGEIKQIAEDISSSADKVVDYQGLHVSVGWFDSSVCFGEPGFEERETIVQGLEVAAQSGYTDIILNPNNHPVTDNSAVLSFLRNKSAESATRLFSMGTLTQKMEGEELSEMYDMFNAGAVAFGDYKHPIKQANLLKIALQYAQSFEGLIQDYADDLSLNENGQVNEGKVSTRLGLQGIPSYVEELRVERDLAILNYTGGRLHFPMISTAGSLQRIVAAKEKGLDVSCSVAIRNLFFTDEKLNSFDSKYKVQPPLRTEGDRKALLKAVEEGWIDMVSSDHQPLNVELKRVEFENASFGSLGLESAFGALNTLLGTDEAVEILSRGRARFKIPEPEIKVGTVANLTFFEPLEEYEFSLKNIRSTSKNSIFIGERLRGKVLGIFSNNQLMWKENEK